MKLTVFNFVRFCSKLLCMAWLKPLRLDHPDYRLCICTCYAKLGVIVVQYYFDVLIVIKVLNSTETQLNLYKFSRFIKYHVR